MARLRRSLVKAAAVLLLSALPLNGQEYPVASEESQSGRLVRLFMDCQGGGCHDRDFFVTEIQFVNWVMDRRDADLHLLITSQPTGSGGRAYELFFIGQDRFENMSDTLTFFSEVNASSDDVRQGLASVMKIGLMRFVGLTPAAADVVISLRRRGPEGPGRGAAMAEPEDDPWDFWVLRTSFNGHGFGESTYKSLGLSGSFTASRTTEAWKASLGLRTSYNESKFDYGELSTLSITRSHSFSALLVKSITDHWSAGLRGGASSSTYTNHRLTLDVSPVLEYNVWTYSESTRRMLTVQYAIETSHFDYVEETLFFKTEETLLAQSLAVSLSMNQPWGTASIYSSAGHFLRDIDQHNAGVGGSVRFRVGRGFSINLSGSVSRIQDLISVPIGEATVEDVLLRRKQLQTDYEYFTSFGLSYTFGSIFNNIVNPRIGRSSGGGMMIIG